ncbi:hypothetical protein ACFXGA_27025 [Actinosynnema sp. NPDC059335]|uniref:hypothetical protein n=1 Tax=Actinosynnema sp. NPDC059335 TaxID=3346804 RepID=UPI00366E44C1
MAIHSRIQLDPTAQISVRPGTDGAIDIVALDSNGDASAVISMTPAQINTVRQATDNQAHSDN